MESEQQNEKIELTVLSNQEIKDLCDGTVKIDFYREPIKPSKLLLKYEEEIRKVLKKPLYERMESLKKITKKNGYFSGAKKPKMQLSNININSSVLQNEKKKMCEDDK